MSSVFGLVAAGLTVVEAVTKFTSAIESAQFPWQGIIATIAGLLTVAFILTIQFQWLEGERLHRASLIALVCLFVIFCVASVLVELLPGPEFTSSLGWLLMLWFFVIVAECATVLRLTASEGPDRGEQIALFVAISLVGTSVMGLAASAISVAVREFRDTELLTPMALTGEALALAALSVTILIARRLVVAMAFASFSFVGVGFGIAAVMNNEVFFGVAISIAGLLSAALGGAIAFGGARAIAAAALATAAAAVYCAWVSWETRSPSTALSFTLLAPAMFVTAFAFYVWRPTDPWRQKNDLDAWTPQKYRIVVISASIVSVALVVPTIASAIVNRTGATTSFVALMLAALAVALITAFAGRRARRVPEAAPSRRVV